MTTPPQVASWPRSFRDRLTGPLPRPVDVWRMVRERGPTRQLLAQAGAVPVAPGAPTGPPPAPEPATTALTWAGHASFVITIGGLTVLTDPVWSRRIPGILPRITPPGIAWSALPPIDAVVISHNHYDHLDAPTIRRLPRDTPVFVPANLGRWFRRRGFTEVREFDWWQSWRLREVEFDFVPAHHWSRRTLTDTCRSLWGGWVLSSGAERIYFAGDTGYGHWFREIGDRYPGIDLALLPVGAYQPRWFMHAMHVDPEEAVQACLDLTATRMVPMHWGTFILSNEPIIEPLTRATEAWTRAGRPRDDLWDLAIGETRTL
ncbi:MBL fold metallo-hydrolase [Natronosporangium hydrolyticum]|uniref:MBL fold metallo-hydrolase n=1 Tax=Natronosporangium hydrolyticum TaxID=2811111 RepID=A0A895YK42_9ACTN|nr:MBL fold metallo-hydrolase [Natronosporangium hydrolyticum]QSB14470.1 MBL fold metallo-hydrolase [Natronosporangium hydrolyticum]